MKTQKEIIDTIYNQLTLDLSCDKESLLQPGTYFCETINRSGQRPLVNQTPYLQIATINQSQIITVDACLMDYAKANLLGKSREDLFAAPFLFGHSLWYIPDLKRMVTPIPNPNFTYRFYDEHEVVSLYQYPHFEYALQYDQHHPCPDKIALAAFKNEQIVAIAGASMDSEELWQVGIDVLPEYTRLGLATYLVSALSQRILELHKIPYYCTASSNIPSQMIAHHCGYMPFWTTTYHHVFDEESPYYSLLKKPLIK